MKMWKIEMNRCLAACVMGSLASFLMAQDSVAELLERVEENNMTLLALRAESDAQKLGNHAEMRLSDPEIGFNYLWGNSTGIGARKDVSVAQEFDVATLTGLKGRVAKQMDELVDWRYRTERMNVLLEAKLAYMDMVCCNALHKLLSERVEQAQSLARLQQKRLDAGEGNMLELGNARLALAKAEAELMALEAEQGVVQGKLEQLNGGHEVAISATEYAEATLPADFAEWFALAESRNPMLAIQRQSVEVNKAELALRRTQALPSLSAGYMGEFTRAERFQGLMLGMTVPLWTNKARVRQAKTALNAARMRQADERLQQFTQLENLYKQARLLKKSVDRCRATVASADNIALLQKALDEGGLSVMDYLVQVGVCYDALAQVIQLERDYQKACARFLASEL